MSELKPCPFCGIWNSPNDVPTKNDMEIIPCLVIVKGTQSGNVRIEETEFRYGEWDISNAWTLLAWNRRTPEPNSPLTLEQLRGMANEPYWHVSLQGASPHSQWNILPPYVAANPQNYHYGDKWLAYRHKLESEET